MAIVPLSAGIILPNNANYMYSGDTSLSGDTFDRPVGNGNMPPNILSPDATADGYDFLSFEVTTPGLYSFEIAATAYAFSSYLFLYQTSFDPANPLTNVLLGETNGDTTASLNATLLANAVYIVVATGFSNFDEGAYTGDIAQIVPENSTFVTSSVVMMFSVIALLLTRPVQ